MENPELSFSFPLKNSEPGAARHGNFPDYYRFNPAEARLDYLRSLGSSHLKKLIDVDSLYLSDLGCNTGELTVGILLLIKQVFPDKTCIMSAIDIDRNLIDCAKTRYSERPDLAFMHGDVMSDNWMELLPNHTHITFCFSVTLWIHIHHGDAGLKSFLERVTSNCSYLVIEPQPWKCYRTAVRRAKRAGQPQFFHFEGLEIRTNVTDFIDHYLTQKCGMKKVKDFGKTNWNRCILLYEKVH